MTPQRFVRAHRPPARGALALLAAVVVTLAATSTASAQGPRPFAAPLSSTDLDRWIATTSPDAATRAAIVEAFEKSLMESQALRDSEMAGYESDWVTRPSRSLSDEELDQRSRKARGIASRQAALEERLFETIAALVPESRRDAIAAERRAAARRRAIASLDPFLRSGFTPDLVEISARAWTGDDAMPDRAAAALRGYDLDLTNACEKVAVLAMASEPAQRAAQQRIDAAEPIPEEGADPDAAMRQRMRNAMKARAEALAPINELRAKAADSHREALAAVSAALPEPQARALRDAFVRAAYPMVGVKRQGPESVLEQAISRSTQPGAAPIPQEAIDSAKSLLTSWRTQDDEIATRMMDAIDARRRTRGGGPMMVFEGDGPDGAIAFDDPIRELRADRDGLDERTRQQLAALDPAFAAIVGEPAAPQVLVAPGGFVGALPQGEVRASAMLVVDAGGGGADAISIELPEGLDFHAAGAPLRAIDAKEFDAMLARLSLDAARAASLRSAWEKYRASADPAMKGSLGGENGMRFEAPGGAVFMSVGAGPEPVDLAAATTLLEAEDARFFAEAETIVGDGDAMEREQGIRARDRLRQRISAIHRFGMRPWGRFERVDLPAIMASTQLAGADRAAAAELVASHGARLSGLLAQMLAASDEVQRIERASVERIEGPGGNVEERINLGGEEWAKAIGALASAQQAVTDEVRRTLDLLAQTLPAPAARSVRRTAYASAMPEVMQDRRAVDERVEQALALSSLDDARRLALIDLLSQHQGGVDRLVDRFIEDALEREKRLGGSAAQGPGPSEMRAMRSADSLQQRLRFDRSEMNDATMRRLRKILTEEENRAIADLGDRGSGGMPIISFPF
ncbi:MAG: hypothetical protein FJ253_02910 [Phycisphaerae bacterium]|nr:hypothetical protein [Phycisphaerae bacterium]